MYIGKPEAPLRPITVSRLKKMKVEGEKIACLTAYDFTFGMVLDQAGMDVILIGDSLGMVIQGHDTTLPVTVDDVVYHTRCVATARQHALIMADMPFMSYSTVTDALTNAGRMMKEAGAHMVKLEGSGDQAEIVARLSKTGIPVCAHLGLQPQLVHKMGGYKVQGRDESSARVMLEDAKRLEAAGADMLLLECVPSELASKLSQELHIPVIGIGAGPGCDGQILVLQDILGITPGRRPKFSKNFMEEQASIQDAVAAYVRAVKESMFPISQHCF
jgi:3-methyl-2-oxobutanoate hydroxymethyltransferase